MSDSGNTAVESVESDASRAEQAAASMQLVSFCLGEEEYGVEITTVQEIILFGEITRLPQTPSYIKGLINLRSMVIPIVDLRSRFGMPCQSPTDDTRIMVANVSGKTVGLIVDAVSQVLRVLPDDVASPPPTVSGLGREYLKGLVRREEGLLIMLDLDKILSDADTAALEATIPASV